MLTQLYIKNIAVISEASIDFKSGLNVFTGETGAGKTILIGAINAVLGERTSREMIRTGEQQAAITALFTELTDAAIQALEQAGYSCEEDSVLIYREISIDGKSSCKINGRPATASILKTVSPLLMNLHGQHDNQILLLPQKHLGFIDSFGSFDALLSEYRMVYQMYTKVQRELESINTDEAQKAHRIDLLNYQIREIDEAELELGEEEQLKSQRKLIRSAMDVTHALGGSAALLDGDEDVRGVRDLFSALVENMTQAAEYLDTAQPVCERLTDLFYELEAISSDIHDLLDSFDCDPSQLDEIEHRLDLIYGLRKKYGSDIEAILQYRDQAAAELEQIETSDVRMHKLKEEVQKLQTQAQKLASEISQKRKKAADAFVKAVQSELVFLDMPSVQLSFVQKDKPLSADGMDEIEFFIATNIGENTKPLAKVASGGELARIMLSIKNVLAGRDEVQTLVFDEVDTGVSGRAAQKIGKKLRQVSQNRQVIVVTHLAQVASFANHHLLIAKQNREGRTFTSIYPLSREERIRELARIAGGETISEIALRHADEMLKEAGN